MASTPAIRKNKETKQQNEGTIASRLKSNLRVAGKSRVSKPPKEKGINKSLVEKVQTKVIKKSSGSTKPKTTDLSSCTTVPSSKNLKQPRKIQSSLGGPSSDNVGKGKERENPTLSQKPQVYKKPLNEKPKHHIRWEGIDNTSTCYTCVLCGKDLEDKEEEEDSIQDGEDELQHYLFSSQGREDLSSTVLSEVAILPCSHIFHETCLSALPLTIITDPPCPICLSMS